jgi:hypothetical protein
MKGGSVASSSVEQLISVEAFDKLNAQFDNQVGGKKKSSSKEKKTTTKQSNKQGKKTNKDNHSTKEGGFCPVCGGGMKHINDFDDEGMFNLYNKKGGASSPTFSMKYDYVDSMMKPVHGDAIPRGLNTDMISMMANDSASSLGSMNKTVQFGNVFDSPKVPFNYTGGSKKQQKKQDNKVKSSKVASQKSSKSKKNPSKKE